jgi:hypothetical protein
MASNRKPVIVRKFSRDWCAGYLTGAPGESAAELEMLDAGGRLVRIGWEQIKWICFVRDLPAAAAAGGENPERLLHKRFSIRPRSAGIWLRMTLKDGEEIEGLAANDRSLIDGMGLMLTPPDTRSNTQRIYIPRSAIESLEALSLIGTAKRRGTASRSAAEGQPQLFGAEPETA